MIINRFPCSFSFQHRNWQYHSFCKHFSLIRRYRDFVDINQHEGYIIYSSISNVGTCTSVLVNASNRKRSVLLSLNSISVCITSITSIVVYVTDTKWQSRVQGTINLDGLVLKTVFTTFNFKVLRLL